jgi:hypothetical protein
MIKKKTIERQWHKQSETAKDEAAELPHGQLKDHVLQEARQLQTASQINLWLSSPGPQPPT